MTTARPITVMMPKGTRTMPIPDPAVSISGSFVALKLVSFVTMVTDMVMVVARTVLLSCPSPVTVEPGKKTVVGMGLEKLASVVVRDIFPSQGQVLKLVNGSLCGTVCGCYCY